ncbi:calcium/sodium antiporter [Sphingobium lignivorans]|uniref:Cation:H+ antiporter n=1 Tax=Sphingobium lignivorans TaxID=2735886 RepID=A0ABR6NGT4_9SPHN|nr:calcium/sodium antiporter [Sphingobium lignivorans]MBB5986492.1 cation:H+ antiporter [Sphingobium lignivorans]
MTALFWCAAGLLLLVLGAEFVVRGGTQLAARLGVPPLVIGLTVVAIGTSTPELAVGVSSALRGEGELSVGNIVGASMINILFVLGLSAVIRPLDIRMQTIRLNLPMIVVASLMLWGMAWDSVLTRREGAMLIVAALAYTAVILCTARRESMAVRMVFAEEFQAEPDPTPMPDMLFSLALLVLGIVASVIGADWLVDGAVALARQWGVSDAFIGLTIVAIGTTSPELVTTIVSTIRNARDIAIGNLLGSSAYNILFILGITCIVPEQGIAIGPWLSRVDMPLLVVLALLCIPVFLSGRRVSRAEGGGFVLAYLVYLVFLVTMRT